MNEFTKSVYAVRAVSLDLKSCVSDACNEDIHDLMNEARVNFHKKWLQVVVEELPAHRVNLDLYLLVAFQFFKIKTTHHSEY